MFAGGALAWRVTPWNQQAAHLSTSVSHTLSSEEAGTLSRVSSFHCTPVSMIIVTWPILRLSERSSKAAGSKAIISKTNSVFLCMKSKKSPAKIQVHVFYFLAFIPAVEVLFCLYIILFFLLCVSSCLNWISDGLFWWVMEDSDLQTCV